MTQDTSSQSGPTGQPGRRALISLAFGVVLAVLVVGGIRLLGGLGNDSGGSGHTITYHVGGGPANVAYGPAGSSRGHGSPMDIREPIGSAPYYYVQAQLDGDGSVSCVISVDGQPVSQASADSPYGVAQCEIVPDGSGGWASVTG
jgi:hypothetical protein